jgi:hypothetical protein
VNASKLIRVLLALLAAVLFQVSVASTTITGNVSIQGPAAPTGPIAGAYVMVSRPNFPTQVLASAKTDSSGNYSITGLPAGRYRVEFSKTGFDDGIMQSHHFRDGVTEQLNASLVPLLSGVEVPNADEKQEVQFTISNPNSFPVSYEWMLPTKGLNGTATATPGTSTLNTVKPPHVEEIELFVDGVQVQPQVPSDVPPPVIIGNLTGSVSNPTGNPLPGVLVNLGAVQGGESATAYTLTDGSFVFHNEPSGFYKLTFTLAGYVALTEVVYLPAGGGQIPPVVLQPINPPPTATVDVTVQNAAGSRAPNVTVAIAYANGVFYTGKTDGTGRVSFFQQPVGVPATITATANDGSGRSASTSSSGFLAGNNSITLTLASISSGSISGTVSGTSNNPLSGVDVVVLGPTNSVVASAMTGANGTYTITGLSAGTYSMTFSLSGYVTGSIGGVGVVSGASTTESISLVTVASTQATVQVNVTDGGSAATGASVSISYSNGTSTATLTTDANGNATFTGQPAGVVGTITAVAGDGTNRSISSSPQAFPAGVTTSVSLALPPVNNAVISGVVKDSTTGLGIPGVQVVVTDSSGNTDGSATTNAAGQYSVGSLGLQTYSVTFSISGYQSATSSASGNTTLNATLIPMDATVNVQVQDTFGNPISGATVLITYVGNEPVSSGTTNANGVVTFTSQLVGVGAVVSVQTSDGRTGSQSGTFAAGSNSANLTVASTVGVVSGVAIDSSTSLPLSNVSVSVVDYNNDTVATTTTNSAGAYVVQDLNPGTYTFTFTINSYQTLSLTVPVTANVASTVNASLTPATSGIQGTVTGSISQSPIPGATLSLTGPASLNTTTDSGGNFSFTGIPAGVYTGTLSSGIFSQSISITANPGQVTTGNLVLDTSSVAGVVTDQNGNDLAGATVVLTGAQFTSSTVTTDSQGNYVVNRESNTGPMTITATFTTSGGQAYTGSEQINVAASPPQNVIPPIVINAASTVAVTVTNGGSPVNGASVTINYQSGSSAGPVTTSGGVATFGSAVLNSPATVSAYYVDSTGTVYTASQSATFSAGANTLALSLSVANAGQSAIVPVYVTDQNGIPLIGAMVTIVYGGGMTSNPLTTDNSGSVQFTSQVTGVGATISVSYIDPFGNAWTSSKSVQSGFVLGQNPEAVVVSVG